jgi:hypothetical protein
MRTSAVLAFIFGIPLLLSPNTLMAIYRSSELNLPGIYQAMCHGAALIALGVLQWTTARAPSEVARPVVLASFVYTALGGAVALIRQLAGLAPVTAWLNVVIYVVLAALFLGMLIGRFEAKTAARMT